VSFRAGDRLQARYLEPIGDEILVIVFAIDGAEGELYRESFKVRNKDKEALF
jgi:hypothetical protein